MPFYMVNSNDDPKIKVSRISLPYKPVLYIFSDILGYIEPFMPLLRALNKLGYSAIRGYHDPRLPSKLNTPTQQTNALEIEGNLHTHAKNIAEEFVKIHDKKVPILFLAYSYGCTLAVQTAQILQTNGYEIQIILLDSPAPSLLKDHLTKKSEALRNDLIGIVNFARLVAQLPNFPENDSSLLESFEVLDTIQFLTKLENSLLELNQTGNQEHFKQYINIIKENLQGLINYDLNQEVQKLKKIHLISLQTTIKTYNNYKNSGREMGWKNHATEIHQYEIDELKQVNHTQLLNPKMAGVIANKIYQIIEIENPLDKIIINLLKDCQDQRIIQNIHDFITDMQITLSNKSINSSTDQMNVALTFTENPPLHKKIIDLLKDFINKNTEYSQASFTIRAAHQSAAQQNAELIHQRINSSTDCQIKGKNKRKASDSGHPIQHTYNTRLFTRQRMERLGAKTYEKQEQLAKKNKF